MIGLLVQLTADIAKIWSTSSLRIMSFSRDDISHDCHEGDWVNIEFDSSEVLQNISRTKDLLQTRRDERGKLQVREVFLVNPRRDKARSKLFGAVVMDKGDESEGWRQEDDTKGHRFLLWMTISSRSEFAIENQPLVKADFEEEYDNSSEGFKRTAEKSHKFDVDDDRKEPNSLNEMILIVGYDPRCKRFFSSSHCGEAVIHESEWRSEGNVQLGDVYRATLRKAPDHFGGRVDFRVINLLSKTDPWEGVKVDVAGSKELRVELSGKIVDRCESYCALDTIPFGIVTYPTDLGQKSLPVDVQIGDYLRVRISRCKSSKPEYPSKWHVKRLIQRLKPQEEEKGYWFEGIVTAMSGSKIFISFKHGNAVYFRNCHSVGLDLGTIVDIRVEDTGVNFEVRDIDSRTRTREDMRVEKNEEGNKTFFSVICPAEVMEQREGYFLLDTPIIGTALFFVGDCPRTMRVGDIWNVKMHPRKEKRDLPTCWIVHAVVEDYPQFSRTEKSMSSERRGRREEREQTNLSHPNRSEEDRGWGTVIITGFNDGAWFGSCYLADSVVIPYSLVRDLPVPDRGAFYRIKCSNEGGCLTAYQLNPNPVYPKDYTIAKDKSSLHVWCYALIKSSQSNSFTLSNDIIGEATLPHKFARSDMRVGDELEALYYRVKTTSNPTHWMVREVGRVSERLDRNRETKKNDGNDGRIMKEEGEKEVSESENCDASERNRPMESPSLIEKGENDRRVLDATRYFMSKPNVKDALKNILKESDFEKIENILERDHT